MKYTSAILVLNGPDFNEERFTASYGPEKYIVAVDGGIGHLKGIECRVDIHIGDMDSSRPGGPVPAVTWSFPPEKNESDFELAMDHIRDQGILNAEVFGATGGRSDHFISNMETASRYAGEGMQVMFTGKNETVRFITSDTGLDLEPGTTVSVFSMTEISTGVELTGFKYNFETNDIHRNVPSGLSNVAVVKLQNIRIGTGVLAVIENRRI